MSGHYRFRRSFGNVSSRFRGATPKHFPLFTGLLDDFGGAAAAYSLRALSANWVAGDVVEVRRSSDSTSQDFTASQITNGELETFCGVGDGFVSIWYDQSGNANNATQGTTTAQPKIVDAGALVVGGLDFDGVDDFFDLGDLALTQPNSVFFVHNSDNQGGGSDVLNDFLDHNGTGGRTLIDSSGGLYRAFAGASDASTKIIVAGADALVSTTINGASSELALNGSNETGLSVGTGGMGEMTLGKSLGGVYDGTFAEFIIYATNQSANRVAIEANINAAYTIF